MKTQEQEAEIFKAIGHPTRLAIVRALAEGERCVNDIANCAGGDVSTISIHLAKLRHAGVVEREQRGKNVFYRLASKQMAGMLRCITSGQCQGTCKI